jgi:ABC-2 type transport system ATP-binding protein
VIELKSFTKNYGKIKAVDNISFIASQKQVTGLVGLNGAGKTTILKAIAGIHFPDFGSVLVNGISVESNPVEIKSQVGFVAEQPNFIPDFMVVEFLKSELEIRRPELSKKEVDEELEKLVEATWLGDVLSKKIKELSKGYRQRLSFARALAGNPSVILLDEPASGLDPRQIVEMRNLVLSLATEKTILISTHILQEIDALCNNIAVIHKGTLKAFGTEKEICDFSGEKNMEDAFLCLTE